MPQETNPYSFSPQYFLNFRFDTTNFQPHTLQLPLSVEKRCSRNQSQYRHENHDSNHFSNPFCTPAPNTIAITTSRITRNSVSSKLLALPHNEARRIRKMIRLLLHSRPVRGTLSIFRRLGLEDSRGEGLEVVIQEAPHESKGRHGWFGSYLVSIDHTGQASSVSGQASRYRPLSASRRSYFHRRAFSQSA